MKKFILFIAFIIIYGSNYSQTITTEWERVINDGNNLPFYIDGFSNVSVEFADIDNDNDYDCFIGTGAGNIAYFKNIGDSVKPVFKLVDSKFLNIEKSSLDKIKATFVDIDYDGDLDLFVGGTERLIFYKNNGDKENFDFILQDDLFTIDDFEDPFKNEFCYPAFVDIDNDDDFDLIYGNYYGRDVFYENTGTKLNPEFHKKNDDYFNFSPESIYGGYDNYHNITFADIDNDNDYDCFIGTANHFLFIENIGIPDSAAWNINTYNYNGNSNYGSGNSPTFCDLDGDNDLDLFVGKRDGEIFYFNNDNSNWTMQNYNPVYFNSGFNPTFCDLDGDNKFEMYFPYSFIVNSIHAYKNIKSLDSVVWQADTAFKTGIIFPYNINKVTFADIDNDLDFDLIVGFGSNPQIFLYKNIGDKYNPTFDTIPEKIATFIEDDEYLVFYPILVDYDNDGDLDLVISAQGAFTKGGGVEFFDNTVTISSPNWEYSKSMGGMGSIDFIDEDNDGDLDIIYALFSDLYISENTGNILNPEFENFEKYKDIDSEIYLQGICFIDMDNDKKKDLIIATGRAGSLLLYKNKGYIVSINSLNQSKNSVKNYPNPAKEKTTVFFNNPNNKKFNLLIYNSNGKLIKSISDINSNKYTIDISDYKTGIYLYELINNRNNQISHGKILKIK